MGRLPREPKEQDASIPKPDVRSLTVSASNINRFDEMQDTREIRKRHVDQLYRDLVYGKRFHQPLSVNKITDGKKVKQYKLIDGNHRMHAIRRFIDNYPDRKSELEFHIYPNLTYEQERQLYDQINKKQLAQRQYDFIKTHRGEIPVLQRMEKDFPTKVHIYPLSDNQTGFRFTTLVRSYLARKDYGAVLNVSEKSKTLTMEDYEIMYQFAQDFVSAFGEPGRVKKGSPKWEPRHEFSKEVGVMALFKVWHANLSTLGREEIVKRWRKMAKNDMVIQMMGAGGVANLRAITRIMAETMNSGTYKKKAITPEEAKEQQSESEEKTTLGAKLVRKAKKEDLDFEETIKKGRI